MAPLYPRLEIGQASGRMGPLVLALWMAAVEGLPPCPEYLEALADGADREAAFDDSGAVAAYERALPLDPEAAEARHGLARALNALGEAAAGPEAEALLGRALRLAESLATSFPDDPEAHYRVAATSGSLLALREGPEKVRLSREVDARARRALALDPCFAPAYVLLGTTYRELASLSWLARGVAGGLLGGLPKGTLEDAERLLAVAVDLDPDDPFARYQLALTLERRKRPREAIARLREVVELSPRAARDLRIQAEAVGRLARIAAASPR
jgi:tetratricopeptide (TPR) repeat protein